MKRPKPDLRPSWRDPNLLCERQYKMPDGTLRTQVDPDYEHRYREFLMETSTHPSWRNDPTYNMRRKP